MNLFKKKDELKDNKKKSKKIISLSSTYESSNEEEYDAIIDNCLKEKDPNLILGKGRINDKNILI